MMLKYIFCCILSIEKKRCESEQIDHDDKDDEDSNKEQYHPRCLLFSGPPQVRRLHEFIIVLFAQIVRF